MGDNKFEIPHEWIVEFVEELDKILSYLNVELGRAMNSKPVLKMESLEELILDLDDNMHALAINLGEPGLAIINRWIKIKTRKDLIDIYNSERCTHTL